MCSKWKESCYREMQKVLTFMLLISLCFTTSSTNLSHKSTNVCKIPPPNLHMITSSRKKLRITHQPSHKLNGENLLGKKNHLRDTKIHCIGQKSFLASVCMCEGGRSSLPKGSDSQGERRRLAQRQHS